MTVHRLDITEAVDLGVIQELNRQFLHPLGLAFTVYAEVEGTLLWGFVQADDPEGFVFEKGVIEEEKIMQIAEMRAERAQRRWKMFGSASVMQPPKWAPEA